MTSYATAPADIQTYGLQPFAIQNIPTLTLQAQLDAASDEADSFLRGRYSLPLIDWGNDVRQHVVWLALPNIMGTRGYNPEGQDETIERRREQALEWFKGVQRRSVHPNVQDSGFTPPTGQVPQVASNPPRGW